MNAPVLIARWEFHFSSLLPFLCLLSLHAGDASDYGVFKAQFFVQTNAGNPVLEASHQYVFHSDIAPCLPGGVLTAYIQCSWFDQNKHG